ncbi:MAG: hypothetical protein IJC48_01625 [Clostridia bacterium]|nr:hypothetical protein [Clostridia bacterium]
MKSYEIKMSRSRWMNLLIAILLIAMIGMLCSPYFVYGAAKETYVPVEDGNLAHLQAKWIMSGVAADQDGYKEIEITSGKDMTVRTTNIIRVHQNKADAAAEAAKEAYDVVAKAAAAAEKDSITINNNMAVVEEMKNFIFAFEGVSEEVTAAAQKSYDNAVKQQAKASEKAADALALVPVVQENINIAYEGAAQTYTADASYAWVTETTEAYEAAINEVYGDAINAYMEKHNSEIPADSKEKPVDYAGAAELYFTTISGEEKDSVIYEKLAAEKEKAAAGYEKANTTVKVIEGAVKDAEKAAKDAASALKSFNKEFDKLVESAAALDAAKVFTASEAEIVLTAIPPVSCTEYEKTNEEPELMETEGKVSYKEKNAALTLTFANGEKIDTTYATSVSMNEQKKLSILGYVGFPYNVEDFSAEMAYKINGFYINDVVLVPIILLLLAVIGIVVCFIKKDKMSSGFLPAAFGIVGIVGYFTSDFLKLGERFWIHVGGYAVVLVVAILHIYLCAKKPGAKGKKSM